MATLGLPQKILRLHAALVARDIPHAFGGALALAWCTQRARGTIDIDLNVFVHEDQARDVVQAMPRGVVWSDADLALLERDGQVRLWWRETPIDLFLNTTEYHEEIAQRARVERFAGEDVPFLSCTDLAVFKAFFDRTKDWADLEEMIAAGTLDRAQVLGVLVQYLGPDDPRVTRVRTLP